MYLDLDQHLVPINMQNYLVIREWSEADFYVFDTDNMLPNLP